MEKARVVRSHSSTRGPSWGKGGKQGGAGEATSLRTPAPALAGCCLERAQAKRCQVRFPKSMTEVQISYFVKIKKWVL